MVEASSEFVVQVASEAELDAWAARLADLLPARMTLALSGDLGAGKTRLVQGIAAALGVPRELVTSPTFVICQIYQGRVVLRHVDLYRVTDEDELWELGAEEWLTADGLNLIEWADRFPHCLPADRLDIRLDIVDETTRRIRLRGFGASGAAIARQSAQATPPAGNEV